MGDTCRTFGVGACSRSGWRASSSSSSGESTVPLADRGEPLLSTEHDRPAGLVSGRHFERPVAGGGAGGDQKDGGESVWSCVIMG